MRELGIARMHPLALGLLRSASGDAPRRAAAPAGSLRSELTQALLGRALLEPADLPEGWLVVTDDLASSLLGRSEFGSLILGETQVRFRHAETRQVVEQHIGIVPRWVMRHLDERADETPRLGTFAGAQFVSAGNEAFAESIQRRYAGAVAVNAMVLRRHGLIMALATWQFAMKRAEALRPRDLATVADARWAPVADALFQPDADAASV